MEEQRRRDRVLDIFKTSLWGFGIIASVLGARTLGAFHALELMVLDRFFTLNTRLSIEAPDQKIAIVQVGQPFVEGSADKGYTITADSLANVLEGIFNSDPAVVGTDIVSYRITGDHQELLSVINQHSNLITVENSDPNIAEPIPGLTSQQLSTQVGFNDLIFDRDGTVRRALLGSSFQGESNDFKFSFPVQVVREYFKNRVQNTESEAIELANGLEDTGTMRFGSAEIPRIRPIYGYTEREIEGVETLINYRGQITPFKVISARELLVSANKDELIKDKIIILNLEGLSPGFAVPLTRVFRSSLNDNDNDQIVTGIEIQAHIISQLVQAVESQRPLISTHQSAQYIFLIIFSILGISCSRFSKDVISNIISLSIVIFSGTLLSYLLLLNLGFWLPLTATLISTTANGLIYINYAQNKRRWEKLMAQRNLALEKERQLSEQLDSQRQKTIENVFDSIHNGPLQTLANLLRRTRDETINLSEVCLSLEDLNREIRYIGDSIKQDASDRKHTLDVSYAGTKFDLGIPLHELFQEVYDAMLSRPLLGFSNLKFTIISFDPIESEKLSIEVKRKLCRFLEEALGNVGKHAVGSTRLVVTGKHKDSHYELTVADNGPCEKLDEVETGEGTRIGKEVSKLTRGQFIHRLNKPKGFLCQLTFPIST
ncbi:sensor histidine kinase [Adonisia turfae]|uniref:CHASE2 domain-containing protein n=1 Tax=Adonisia turfae CCMR0081 TaxID=2292702 RepID=A0A6M0RJR5_9CYAN|nr:CHASE2 domain-containing protein [Adonisia turfae]NEZ55901.1 CHASE2 domain-containing protein [Adonisia turfae CCMR0081]